MSSIFEANDSAAERGRSPAVPTSSLSNETLATIVLPCLVSKKDKRELTNWGGSFVARPARIFAPTNVEQVCAIVELARRRGVECRAYGRGHSPSDLMMTKGWTMLMQDLSGVISVS